jgi:hypothetical protein
MRVVRRRGREPRTHWVLLSVLLVLILVALAVSGVIHGQVGESSWAPASHQNAGSVPPEFVSGGPIVDHSNQSKAVCTFQTGMWR